jgi:hypothetical protein
MTTKKEKFKFQDEIDEWFKKKTKLKNENELGLIENYLKFKKINTKNIKLSNDYIFKFYDIKSEDAKNLKLRTESIFKLSINKIINKFKIYFHDQIEFEINFENPNYLESYNENKNLKNCCKHDAEINIINKETNKSINVILEYNEKKYHEKVYDSYKDTKSKFNSNLYLIFDEKNEYSNKQNMKLMLKKFVVDVFCIICTLLNNKNILSKIIYFEDIEYSNDDELENKTNIFNYIMKIKEKNSFNLKDLFLILRPYNQDGDEYSYKKYIKYLKSEYKIELVELGEESYIYDSKYFSQIIMFMDLNTSDNILEYKQIYLEFQNALDKASNKIIEFNKRHFEKYELLPRYLKNYVEFDLINNNDNSLLKNIHDKLNKKFSQNT